MYVCLFLTSFLLAAKSNMTRFWVSDSLDTNLIVENSNDTWYMVPAHRTFWTCCVQIHRTSGTCWSGIWFSPFSTACFQGTQTIWGTSLGICHALDESQALQSSSHQHFIQFTKYSLVVLHGPYQASSPLPSNDVLSSLKVKTMQFYCFFNKKAFDVLTTWLFDISIF